MSASRAVISSTSALPYLHLEHFTDVIVATVQLHGADGESWILMASVVLWNADSSNQFAEATLVRDTNVEIEKVRLWLSESDNSGVTLYAGLKSSRDIETIMLVCNTYSGGAFGGRIVALRVDDIEFQ